MAEALTVDGLVVRYGDRVAVDGVDLAVGAGEIVAVLGPSGCGKSSLLRAVAGLERPAAGRLALGARDLAGVPPHRRGIGLMFQDHALFPHLDVAGNVGFGPRMQGRSRADRARRVGEVLDLVGLADRSEAAVAELSGGEQQRVALARALAPDPAAVLLDEPFGALDRALREDLLDQVATVLREVGVTTVLVTHDQGEAFAVADRVAVMRDGRFVRIAAPEALWSEPGSAWVARFLGLVNVGERADGTAELWRPDHLVLGPPAGEGLPGTVERRRFRGGRTEVRVRLVDRVVEVWTPDAGDLEAGDPVTVTVPGSAVTVLPDGDPGEPSQAGRTGSMPRSV